MHGKPHKLVTIAVARRFITIAILETALTWQHQLVTYTQLLLESRGYVKLQITQYYLIKLLNSVLWC